MRRRLETHKCTPLNEAIGIEVADDLGPGGGNHHYVLTTTADVGVINVTDLVFQNGPIGEVGINGISNEALLAVIQDRLDGFSRGKFSCVETELALSLVRTALEVLKSRTKRRISQGTEGTMAEVPDCQKAFAVRREGMRVVIQTFDEQLAKLLEASL
jgi:hypothetical protein